MRLGVIVPSKPKAQKACSLLRYKKYGVTARPEVYKLEQDAKAAKCCEVAHINPRSWVMALVIFFWPAMGFGSS